MRLPMILSRIWSTGTILALLLIIIDLSDNSVAVLFDVFNNNFSINISQMSGFVEGFSLIKPSMTLMNSLVFIGMLVSLVAVSSVVNPSVDLVDAIIFSKFFNNLMFSSIDYPGLDGLFSRNSWQADNGRTSSTSGAYNNFFRKGKGSEKGKGNEFL